MNKISKETQEQAMKVARATQRPKQTKEQTKLISQGIEKGIAEYKKQQSKKSREQDKARKARSTQLRDTVASPEIIKVSNSAYYRLPWALLILNWIGFLLWYLIN